MLGKEEVENTFGQKLANKFNIHRTRQNFPNDGVDNFHDMARIGIYIVDRVVQEQMEGGVDLKKDIWYMPERSLNILPGK